MQLLPMPQRTHMADIDLQEDNWRSEILAGRPWYGNEQPGICTQVIDDKGQLIAKITIKKA